MKMSNSHIKTTKQILKTLIRVKMKNSYWYLIKRALNVTKTIRNTMIIKMIIKSSKFSKDNKISIMIIVNATIKK